MLEAEALAMYEEAYIIYPSPKILFNIALEEKLTGQRLQAIRHFREVMRNPLLSPRETELGKKYVAELERSFGRIDVKGPHGMVVSLDGEQVTLPLPEPLDVKPGAITASGEMDGQHYDGAVTAEAGKTVTLQMKSPHAPASHAARTPLPTEEHNNTRYVVSGSLAVLGLAGVGLGIGFTAAANSSANDVGNAKARTGTTACAGVTSGDCDARGQSAASRARNSNLAVGSYVGGGILLAAGVVTYFVWPKPSKESAAAVVPWIGKDGAGLSYGKEF